MIALAAKDGKHLEEFKKDPIKAVLYSIGMDEKTKGGYEMAEKAHKHYFGDGNIKDEDLISQYGQVMIIFFWNKLLKCRHCVLLF